MLESKLNEIKQAEKLISADKMGEAHNIVRRIESKAWTYFTSLAFLEK